MFPQVDPEHASKPVNAPLLTTYSLLRHGATNSNIETRVTTFDTTLSGNPPAFLHSGLLNSPRLLQ